MIFLLLVLIVILDDLVERFLGNDDIACALDELFLGVL